MRNYERKFSAVAPVFALALICFALRLTNTGKNYWTFEPGLNFNWLSSKIGTEVTLFTGLDFNTENEATHYQSGASFHLDAGFAF